MRLSRAFLRLLTRRIVVVAGATALALALAALVYAQVGGSYDLSWSTVGGGGGTFSTGGPYSVGGTIGQPDAGAQTGGQYTLHGGFWGGAMSLATPTATATNTATNTVTGTPSGTSTATATSASTGTPTQTPTITATSFPANTSTSTSTPTSNATSTVTPTACPYGNTYAISSGQGTLVPGTADVGIHCDDCDAEIVLPFPYRLYQYGTYFATVKVGSNGQLAFRTDSVSYTDLTCLPNAVATYVVAPYWTDQVTACSGCGIFTSVSGSAPNRVFNIEWRTIYFGQDPSQEPTLDYEVQLFENQLNFTVVYGLITPYASNDSALTIGIEKNTGLYTQWACDPTGGSAPPVSSGEALQFTVTCLSATSTATSTSTATPTGTRTNTPTQTPTATASATSIATGTNTATTPSDTPTTTGTATNTATITLTATPTATACPPSWQLVSSPNQGAGDNYLYAVAAISSNDVWAVGYYGSGIPIVYSTLIEHWNGSVWTIMPSPNQGTGNSNYLYGVSAISTSDVWAVGYYNNGTADQTLAEHWNGSTWSIVASPNQGTGDNSLYAVVRVSGSDVWAVGTYNNGTATQTLAEHWDGSTWSIVTSPSPAAATNVLRGAAAIASNDIWAVGFQDNGGRYQTLTEHWDGSTWSAVPSNPSLDPNLLTGAVAVLSNNVWAAGYTWDGAEWQTLVEHWNGSTWSTVSPVDGPGSNILNGMTAATSANNVWAVGYYDTGTAYTFTQHWDGSMWSIVPSPNQNPGHDNYLNGVAAISANDMWTVGYYYNNTSAVYQTLVEHWTVGSCARAPAGKAAATPTATPKRKP